MFDVAIRSLNALLMIAMPLALGVYLYRKLGSGWRLFGVGAVTFVASQLLHIPFNIWVLNPFIRRLDESMASPTYLIIAALLLGLSAGVFEEVARYLVYRFRLVSKQDRSWAGALMFGAGHGGIESILIGVLVVNGFIRLFAYKDANLETLIPIGQVETVRAQVILFWSLPWYAAILGAVERAATLCFHMSATVLVLQVFLRKHIMWLFAAIGLHALFDAMAVYASQIWNVYVTEALIVAAGIVSIGIIFLLREKSFELDEKTPAKTDKQPIEIETQKPSKDHLEDSRYV
jgi:uncharacterized membrane protein YhfC